MGRHAKVKNWTADKDLHIIRKSEQSIVNRIKNKQEGVYYFIDKDGIYNVVDTRKNKCITNKFNSAEEVISYYNEKE